MPYARTADTASGVVAVGDGTEIAWEESGTGLGTRRLHGIGTITT
ncbi:hypothetical protein [Curtobacterium sp. MCBD17_008]|nr:hypothetical protein [Curtobacterium sp. MCBD17_008]